MDMILHAALFKGYWIPPAYGEKKHVNMLRRERRKVDDPRKKIIDAMIVLGNRITVQQIAEHIGDNVTAQIVMHHMKKMHGECLVKRAKSPGKPVNGGQPPALWSLVL